MQELQGDEAAVALAVQRAHARAQAAELASALPAGPAGPQPRSAAQHLPRASQGGPHNLVSVHNGLCKSLALLLELPAGSPFRMERAHLALAYSRIASCSL